MYLIYKRAERIFATAFVKFEIRCIATCCHGHRLIATPHEIENMPNQINHCRHEIADEAPHDHLCQYVHHRQ